MSDLTCQQIAIRMLRFMGIPAPSSLSQAIRANDLKAIAKVITEEMQQISR